MKTIRFDVMRGLAVTACLIAGAALAQSLGWKQLPGAGIDIGVGPDGTAWAIGSNKVAQGGYGAWRWSGKGWQAMPGGAVRIDVDPKGNAWAVSDNGAVWRWTGQGWNLRDGVASAISVDPHGRPWAVSPNQQVWQAANK